MHEAAAIEDGDLVGAAAGEQRDRLARGHREGGAADRRAPLHREDATLAARDRDQPAAAREGDKRRRQVICEGQAAGRVGIAAKAERVSGEIITQAANEAGMAALPASTTQPESEA